MGEGRLLPVPDALVGERVDAALSRMLGMSRSKCADLAAQGAVTLNGRTAGKSDRLGAADIIGIDMPDPAVKAVPVTGMDILYDDEDIVVVDKPVGAAAGRARRSWATSPPRATASPPTARPSARASSTASTWAPPGP